MLLRIAGLPLKKLLIIKILKVLLWITSFQCYYKKLLLYSGDSDEGIYSLAGELVDNFL